jgi:hypothetical protein
MSSFFHPVKAKRKDWNDGGKKQSGFLQCFCFTMLLSLLIGLFLGFFGWQ